jgi:hypothetical protein
MIVLAQIQFTRLNKDVQLQKSRTEKAFNFQNQLKKKRRYDREKLRIFMELKKKGN